MNKKDMYKIIEDSSHIIAIRNKGIEGFSIDIIKSRDIIPNCKTETVSSLRLVYESIAIIAISKEEPSLKILKGKHLINKVELPDLNNLIKILSTTVEIESDIQGDGSND